MGYSLVLVAIVLLIHSRHTIYPADRFRGLNSHNYCEG